jgi:bacterioferritin-associated ferredoxin
MVLENGQPHNKPLKQSLIDSGFDVIARVNEDVNLQTNCSEIKTDVVIIDVASPSQDILDNISKISDQCAIPVIMFTGQRGRGKIICNCLDVAENDIIEACNAGADLITLKNKFQCGTECGSCLPELKRLVQTHSKNI